MHLALYAPGLGYYSAGLPKIGPRGDFITAPELTPLFGQTLGNQCAQVLRGLNDPIVFEFGAGSGQLCVDVLRRLEQLECLPRTYHILEVSGHLKQRQRACIARQIPHLESRIIWHTTWPKDAFSGVMIANEVLDAMPVHRFLQTPDGLLESYVGLNEQGELYETFKTCTNARLKEYVQTNLPEVSSPYQSEANLFLESWFEQCSEMLLRGAFFILDYGFPRHEYYHPDRAQGTLMCHHHHRSHTNPLAHPGEEDITAHVDFTHVAEAAHEAGFHVAGYTNQASFLLANGLLSFLEPIKDATTRLRTQQAVMQLIQPSEMGELFKVIALSKGVDERLTGFELNDKRASL